MERSELMQELRKLSRKDALVALKADLPELWQSIWNRGHGEATEQARLREDRLKEQVTELEAKVPSDGSVVLKGDDAKAYEAYKALGKPEELKAQLDKVPELQEKLDTRDRQDGMRAAADAHGYDFDVLKDLPGAATGSYEVKEEGEGDQKKKVAYFTPGEKDAKPVKLAEHVDATWSKFKVALEAGGNDAPRGRTQERTFARQTARERSAGDSEVTVEELAASKRASGNYGL